MLARTCLMFFYSSQVSTCLIAAQTRCTHHALWIVFCQSRRRMSQVSGRRSACIVHFLARKVDFLHGDRVVVDAMIVTSIPLRPFTKRSNRTHSGYFVSQTDICLFILQLMMRITEHFQPRTTKYAVYTKWPVDGHSNPRAPTPKDLEVSGDGAARIQIHFLSA